MADDIGSLTEQEYQRRIAEQQQLSELEKNAQEAPKQEENEGKKEKGFFRKAFDLAYLSGAAIGTTFLSSAFVGPLGYLVGAAFPGGGLIGSMIKGVKYAYECCHARVLLSPSTCRWNGSSVQKTDPKTCCSKSSMHSADRSSPNGHPTKRKGYIGKYQTFHRSPNLD